MVGGFFSGKFEHTLDPKGRVTLPAKYRERFRHEALLVRLPGPRCISVFPPETWSEYDRKYLEPLDVHADARSGWEIRNTFGNLDSVVPDAQGRVLVQDHHVKDLNLSGKVTILGNRDRLEIWDSETLKAEEAKWLGGEDA